MSKQNQKSKLQYLVKLLLAMQDETEVIEFLKGLFTPNELTQIPLRLEIIKRLKQKQPQRQIAETLGVGIATVTRGESEIKKGRFKNIV